MVRANDNRTAAGSLVEGATLSLHLVVRPARWYPEAASGPSVIAPVFAEDGGAPQIPGPLIRMRAGTMVIASVRNALPDSTVTVYGLQSRPAATDDSIVVPPGATETVQFPAGAPGTYFYWGRAGTLDTTREREQLAGAFVVDPVTGRTDDRVFVINIWGEPIDSVNYQNALAINGRSWPYTERLSSTVGDTVRWRVVNASLRGHPMHLHGFYYRIDAKGTALNDTTYRPADRRLVVTEQMRPGQTMRMAWTAQRLGNWLFHCHLGFHVVPETRLDPPRDRHDQLSHDATQHMAGLVLGVTVQARGRTLEAPRGRARAMRLLAQEGRRRGRAPRSMGFVLQRGPVPPAVDSVELSSSPLVLTRGQPTDITVVNHLPEATAVHWHGIELESYSDGVAGWSGIGQRLAPAIAPGDSFTARLTLRRAGTFIYHTHLNDLEQLTSGLYGPIIVLEPRARFDPATDHIFVAGWDGPEDPPHLVVNGDSLPPPVQFAYGVSHRLRFVNIGVAGNVRFALSRNEVVQQWRALAKDGADLPTGQATERTAALLAAVGETYDVEFVPRDRGEYSLTATSAGKRAYILRVMVK